MTRLQRELTTRFFMAGAEKVLITFSAGVARLESGEAGNDAIKRGRPGHVPGQALARTASSVPETQG